MRNKELSRQIQRINDLIRRTDKACGGNIELQAEWARFICVISAGLLENAIKELYIDFSRKKVTAPLASFVSSTLSPIRSPKSSKFLDTAGAFNSIWKDELQQYLDTDGRGDAIDSIMSQRHLIAHGKAHTSNITLANVKDYLKKSIEVLEFIEEQCEK